MDEFFFVCFLFCQCSICFNELGGKFFFGLGVDNYFFVGLCNYVNFNVNGWDIVQL